MRALGGFCLALLFAGGLFAQSRGGSATPVLRGGFGNVVYPGGTSVNNPNIQRSFGNVVFPGGGGPHLVVPNANNNNRYGHRGGGGGGGVGVSSPLIYSYPLFAGSGYDSSYGAAPVEQAEPQQPNVTVIYPPQQAPVIINHYDREPPVRPEMNVYQPTAPAETEEPVHYLLAFKNHTIYSAVAYWVDGETLHYFTAGNTHNQVSLSLIDREMTDRLNRESGVDVKLPAPKK